jgi:hypothetical protein
MLSVSTKSGRVPCLAAYILLHLLHHPAIFLIYHFSASSCYTCFTTFLLYLVTPASPSCYILITFCFILLHLGSLPNFILLHLFQPSCPPTFLIYYISAPSSYILHFAMSCNNLAPVKPTIQLIHQDSIHHPTFTMLSPLPLIAFLLFSFPPACLL